MQAILFTFLEWLFEWLIFEAGKEFHCSFTNLNFFFYRRLMKCESSDPLRAQTSGGSNHHPHVLPSGKPRATRALTATYPLVPVPGCEIPKVTTKASSDPKSVRESKSSRQNKESRSQKHTRVMIHCLSFRALPGNIPWFDSEMYV